MRICTQCGHKLSTEEFLCPACELWDSNSYTPGSDRRRSKTLTTVFVGPFQQALLVRQLCESSGIPAWLDADRGAALWGDGAVVRVRVPAERADDAAEVLSLRPEEDGSDPSASDPGLRRKRSHLRARLSLRRRAWQALAWSVAALLFPPAGLIAGRLALSVLSENRNLPVVTEETRVATAALVISCTAMVLCAVLAWLVVRSL